MRQNKVCRKLIALAIDRLELGERSAVYASVRFGSMLAIDRLKPRERSATPLLDFSLDVQLWRSFG